MYATILPVCIPQYRSLWLLWMWFISSWRLYMYIYLHVCVPLVAWSMHLGPPDGGQHSQGHHQQCHSHCAGITATPIHTHGVVQGWMSGCNMCLVSKIQTCSLILRPWNEVSSNPELHAVPAIYPRLWEISETKLLDLRLLAPIHKAMHVLGGDCMALFTVGCSGPWNSNHEWSMDP